MLLLIVLLPFVGALLPALLRGSPTARAWATAAAPIAALLLLAIQTPAVFAGHTVLLQWPWLPQIGLSLGFRLDGLGLLFGFLILGIGLLVILYARYYLSPQEPIGRFYAFLLLFMGSMLGVVLSENLLLLVVFWELTSLSSFLLIGYWRHRADARQGARMALAVTGAGGLALLAGVLLLGHVVGSLDLSVVLVSGDVIREHPLYGLILILILLGVFTKSAQFPFHFWLPHAMAAPTPVSAYLHSATMVKAGIFLLGRLFPALAGTDLWIVLVSGAGLITLVMGAYIAMFQHDLKGLLAYSTISHLGLITLLFGLSTPLSEVAAIFHIINHATFKASLFMAAGIVDHECGTRDMRRINGLFKYMPHTAVLAMVAAAAMAGVPLLNGFLSKEMFFGESLEFTLLGQGYWILPALATVAGALSVAYSLRFIHDVFFNGEPVNLPRTPHEPPRWMKIPVEILVVLCLLVGMFPSYTAGPLLAVAARASLGGELPEYHLAVWHGFNLPLAMSAIALICGAVMYFSRYRVIRMHDAHPLAPDGKRLFERWLADLIDVARRVTGALETGSLQHYIALLVAAALLAGAIPLLRYGGLSGPLATSPLDVLALASLIVLSVGALGGAWLHHRRLLALVLLSAVGLVVALIFVIYSAPDLALTQLVIELATIVLLLLALYFLPQRAFVESTRKRRQRDLVLSGLAGVGVAALAWGVLTRPYETIAGYFLTNSVPGGGGTNVVNVILVDFRGFDTLGEITVLAIAALGVYALLDGLELATPARDPRGRLWAADRHPVILWATVRPLMPLILLVAVYIFLRGHNLPGGGFIAGLIAALAVVMQYLASGADWTRQRLQPNYVPVIAIGLLIALATGLGAWLFGYPFLTSTHGHVHLPWIGDFELASAMAFDTGVFLTVVGVVLLILAYLGDLGITSRTKQETFEWKP